MPTARPLLAISDAEHHPLASVVQAARRYAPPKSELERAGDAGAVWRHGSANALVASARRSSVPKLQHALTE